MRDQPIERNTLTPLYLKAASQIGRSDLSELATLEEGWFVELKERTPDPAKFAKSISSFANSHGGLLVIGAKEEQKTRRLSSFSPMPRDFAVKCVERARDAVIAHISPPLYFDSNIIEIETIDRHAAERWIVVISIPKGNRGPYLHSNGCIYVRIGDASSPFPLSDLSLQGKVCTTLVATSADARVFRWRQLRCDLGHSRADSRPVVDPFGRCGRTHPRAPCKSVRRTIHRLESANSVCSCAVFLAKPR